MIASLSSISARHACMYVTTFPCHNCAKHIIAAGLDRVVFIEPYPKSKAFEFYSNEITTDSADSCPKVLFEPFYGVGPHKFLDLFSMKSIRWRKRQRKGVSGEKVDWNASEASLRNPVSPLDYITVEMAAHLAYSDKVRELEGGSDAENG